MMGSMARRSLRLEGNGGTAFYVFRAIPDTKAFITQWYATLNDQPLSEWAKGEIVDEANRVFACNIAIFEELDGRAYKAMWTLATRAMVDLDRRIALKLEK